MIPAYLAGIRDGLSIHSSEDLQYDQTWYALESNQAPCRELPSIVTGIQPVGC